MLDLRFNTKSVFSTSSVWIPEHQVLASCVERNDTIVTVSPELSCPQICERKYQEINAILKTFIQTIGYDYIGYFTSESLNNAYKEVHALWRNTIQENFVLPSELLLVQQDHIQMTPLTVQLLLVLPFSDHCHFNTYLKNKLCCAHVQRKASYCSTCGREE